MLSKQAVVLREGFLDMQVCAPNEMTDEQVIAFAEHEYPCGTINGWFICKQGDKALSGGPERNPCEERPGFVHIALVA